jgi:acyl-CoA thioester hydrolase|tara:strand:- start:501 stop:845 length:345 start_codon:yes stop_codon:yes gene_type:complete
MGIVYYANYFVWFEIGRTDLLRSLGWSYREMEDSGIALPVIEAECQYRQSAHYDDELEIDTKGTLLSAVRIAFDYEIVRRSDRAINVSGRTVHAAVNNQGRPCRLPDRICEGLQ